MTENRLRQVHSECMTPNVTSYPVFIRFLRNACHVSWQLQLTTPPLVPVADRNMPYNSFTHVSHYELPAAGSNESIAYYVWPMLIESTTKTVLVKGRVTFTQSLRM